MGFFKRYYELEIYQLIRNLGGLFVSFAYELEIFIKFSWLGWWNKILLDLEIPL